MENGEEEGNVEDQEIDEEHESVDEQQENDEELESVDGQEDEDDQEPEVVLHGVFAEDQRPMVLKEIRVSNFKSFNREVILDHLGPGLHIIVGENGSGKSNILSAISLAISDDLQKLHERERKELICSFTKGNRSAEISALLDNAFKSIPGQAEVKFHQTVAKNNFKFLLNGIQSELGGRTMNIFNMINRLYYIKQGEITGFVMLSDEQRLNLVKNITSYSVWEDEKEKILSEMKLHGERLKMLEANLDEINAELERQREELVEVERYELRRKELEVINYCLLALEHAKVDKKFRAMTPGIEAAKSAVATNNEEFHIVKRGLDDRQSQLTDLTLSNTDKEWHKTTLLANIDLCVARQQSLKNEQKELLGQKMQLQTLGDRSSNIPADLEKLERSIVGNHKTFLDARANENSAFLPVAKGHTSVKFLKELIGRGGTRGDPAFCAQVKAELRKVKQERQVTMVKRKEAEALYKRLEVNVNSSIGKLKNRSYSLLEKREAVENLKIELRSQQAQRRQLQLEQVKNWDDKSKMELKINEIKEKLEALLALLRIAGGKLYQGYQHLDSILTDFKHSEDPDDQLAAASYFGLLVENISAREKEYTTAIEVACGRKLFYHLVSTRAAGMRILKEFNRRKCRGDLYFLPEDTLKVLPHIGAQDGVVTGSSEARLLNHVQCHKRAERFLPSVVGNYLVVKDMKDVRRNKSFNYVSMDGDLVKSNGLITGGYRDSSKSPISYITERNVRREELDAAEKSLTGTIQKEESIRQELRTIDDNINSLRLLLDKNGAETEELRKERDRLMFEVTTAENAQADASVEATKLFQKEELLMAGIRQMEEDAKDGFKPPTSTTAQSLRDFTEELVAANDMHKLETQKRKDIQNALLDLQLRRRILLSRLGGDSNMMDDRQLPLIEANLLSTGEELKGLKQSLADVRKAVKTLEAQLKTDTSTVNTLAVEIERFTAELSDKSAALAAAERELEVVLSNRLVIVSKKVELENQLETLDRDGVVNKELLEAHRHYALMGTVTLYAKLVEMTDKHNKSAPVNLRAADTIEELRSKKNDTVSTLSETRKDLFECEKFLEHMSQIGPMVSLWNTKHIQISFRMIYQEIVGASGRADRDGIANFALYSDTREFGYTDSLDGPGGDDPTYWADHKFTGAKLEIINGNTRHDIRTLSGGQRTVLALAFILAIQRNTPAGLFLMDEIDQALDEDYTRGVVEVLKRFCKEERVQFFCTTFNKAFAKEGDKIFHVTHTGTTSAVTKIGVAETMQLSFLGRKQMTVAELVEETASGGSAGNSPTQ